MSVADDIEYDYLRISWNVLMEEEQLPPGILELSEAQPPYSVQQKKLATEFMNSAQKEYDQRMIAQVMDDLEMVEGAVDTESYFFNNFGTASDDDLQGMCIFVKTKNKALLSDLEKLTANDMTLLFPCTQQEYEERDILVKLTIGVGMNKPPSETPDTSVMPSLRL